MYKIFKITSNSTIDFAAEELKKYLRMMMPRCGEVPISYDKDADSFFRIGLMSDFGLDTSDAADIELDDIVYIDADEKGGIIAGSNPGATLIAIYRYLRFCGCRWLFPGIDGEWIPVIDGLPKVNYRKLADHRYRGQCNEGAEYQPDMIETIDFSPKIGMNSYMIEFDNPYYYYNTYYQHLHSTCRKPEPVTPETILQWKRQCEVEMQKRGLHFHDMGHGWTAEPFGFDSTLGWESSEEIEIPEDKKPFVAMLNGERKIRKNAPLLSNICMSNPKARDIMAKYIADYAEKQNNVDFLHIWLADESNCHCECEECQKKDTSDWYMMLLNDIDAEFDKRNLNTRLVFICYLDTFWAPHIEKLNGTKRFTMLYAPITRTYNETYAKDADMSALKPYIRNNIQKPRGMAECLAYLYDWKEMWKGDCFCYEYHFLGQQFSDFSHSYMPRLVYDDIRALKKHGLNGIIEDGSQRSYFPTGLQFYVYGETLFDSSVEYDDLVEDYFSHAYGENWKLVKDYLDTIGELTDRKFTAGQMSVDPEKGKFFCPEYAVRAAKLKEHARNFKAVVEENRHQPRRASCVAWQLIGIHAEWIMGMADIFKAKAIGDNLEAIKAIDRIKKKMSEIEIYIERYYDHYFFGRGIDNYAEGMREQFANALREADIV